MPILLACRLHKTAASCQLLMTSTARSSRKWVLLRIQIVSRSKNKSVQSLTNTCPFYSHINKGNLDFRVTSITLKNQHKKQWIRSVFSFSKKIRRSETQEGTSWQRKRKRWRIHSINGRMLSWKISEEIWIIYKSQTQT